MKTRQVTTSLYPPVLALICRSLDEKKAGDIRVLKVSEQSSITDYLVLATGTSDPHLRALRVDLEKVLDVAKVHIVGMDTSQESGWLVIDAFDVMIHVMTAENRQKYALENLWKDAQDVAVADVLEQPKAKAKVKKPTAGAAGKKTPASKPTKRPPAKKRATKG